MSAPLHSKKEETLSFKADEERILELFTHSLYSNQEIFLRELISNASDADGHLDSAALSDSALYETDPDLKIWVDVDKESRTITVRDNGIGMSREEAIEHLGMIGKSGTRALQKKYLSEEAQDKASSSESIGQFGVGFYSAFIVSDRVVVRSRRAGAPVEQGIEWSSDAQGEYTIKSIDCPLRGTAVELHIKKDADEFLEAFRLRSIITKYSNHTPYPILMKKAELPTASDQQDDEAASDQEQAEVQKKEPEEEVVNIAKALWIRPKEEITEEEYQNLYKDTTHDFENALTWSHNKVEGNVEYISLLFIPSHKPFDLWNREGQGGIKLHVKCIFIMDGAEHFMPTYLRFVKGIIDANDLPLNISRELLQSNPVINKIKSACVKRVLRMLEDLSKNKPDDYAKFWKEFGQVMKEGLPEDFANRDTLAGLLRFSSTHNHQDSTQNVTLKDYVSRMKSEQKKIYFIIADSYETACKSPLLEVFQKKDVEVLLLSDRIDEWLVGHLTEFEGHSLQSVAKGSLDLEDIEKIDEAEEEKIKEVEKGCDDFVKRLQDTLGDTVKAVRTTRRLTESPTCVVFDESEMSGNLQRLLKQAGQDFSQSKPILEINPEHALILRAKTEMDQERFSDWANILFSQALLTEGEPLKDPAEFVKKLNQLLLQ